MLFKHQDYQYENSIRETHCHDTTDVPTNAALINSQQIDVVNFVNHDYTTTTDNI